MSVNTRVPGLGAYKKTTCRKQIALEIITTNIISRGYASDFTRRTNSSATTFN